MTKTSNEEDLLLQRQQAVIGEEQLQMRKEMLEEQRSASARQEQFAREQWKITKSTQRWSTVAAVVAAFGVVASAGATLWSGYVLKHQSAPVCNPAKVEVAVPPPAAAPNVTVTLDSSLLPVRNTVSPAPSKKGAEH